MKRIWREKCALGVGKREGHNVEGNGFVSAGLKEHRESAGSVSLPLELVGGNDDASVQ